jgi:hypothetical protein
MVDKSAVSAPRMSTIERLAQVDFSHFGAGRSVGGMHEEDMRPEADNSDKD